MFENIGNVSFLGIMIGIIIIAFSFVRYKKTRDKAWSFILFSIGIGLLGPFLIVHYIMTDCVDIDFLLLGGLDIILAVWSGLRGIYALGTGKPRTYLMANQEMHIVGSVALKTIGTEEYFQFKVKIVPGNKEMEFLIPEEKFPIKRPYKGLVFKTDSQSNIVIE